MARLPVALGTAAMMRNSFAASNDKKDADKFVVGIQTHAHDFLYEGADNVVQTACEKASANAVFTCATYVKENMRLPHNPSFTRYPTQGGFYFDFDADLYADGQIKPVRTPEENVSGFDAIRVASSACRKRGVKFYAWVSSFNFPQEGPSYPDHQVIGADGHTYTDWLCPNSPEAREFSLTSYEDLLRNYDIDGVFVDRFRFPDDVATCFCDHCTREMKEAGLDARRIREAMVSLATRAPTMEYLALMKLGMSIDPAFYVSELPELTQLVRFKMGVITDYTKSLYQRVKSINPKTEVGLDMFSPSVAWQVGQDPRTLVEHCDWIKPMAYHLGDGYEAIRGVTALSEAGLGTVQETYDELKRMMAPKGMVLPDTFDEFRKTSFPTTWIETEMNLARDLTDGRKPLYAGLQLWRPATPATAADAVRAAVRAKSDGVFLYCYGWSSFENLEAVGDTLGVLGLA